MSYFPARVSFCLFVSGFRANLVDLYLYLQSKRFMTGLVFAIFFFFKRFLMKYLRHIKDYTNSRRLN